MNKTLSETLECILATEQSPEFVKLYEQTRNLIQQNTEIVPDFPSKGINFVNFIPMLARDPGILAAIVECLSLRYRCAGLDAIAGIDARGFIFAAPLAYELHVPFLAVRKAGKLPPPVDTVEYDSEYAHSALEIEKELVKPGQRILFVDDILATGGTFLATRKLVENLGASLVEAVFIGELSAVGARERVQPTPLFCFHDFIN